MFDVLFTTKLHIKQITFMSHVSCSLPSFSAIHNSNINQVSLGCFYFSYFFVLYFCSVNVYLFISFLCLFTFTIIDSNVSHIPSYIFPFARNKHCTYLLFLPYLIISSKVWTCSTNKLKDKFRTSTCSLHLNHTSLCSSVSLNHDYPQGSTNLSNLYHTYFTWFICINSCNTLKNWRVVF